MTNPYGKIMTMLSIGEVVYYYKPYTLMRPYIVMSLLSIYFPLTASVVLWLACSSVVDRGFEPRVGQTKDYKIASPLSTQH